MSFRTRKRAGSRRTAAGRNYYFSSMSFRTKRSVLGCATLKSQLLFQQYVLSDSKCIKSVRVKQVATTISAVCPFGPISVLMKKQGVCRNYYFSSMSFRTQMMYSGRTMPRSRNYYFSSMSFRTRDRIDLPQPSQVATTISAVCPFGRVPGVDVSVGFVATTISAVCPFGPTPVFVVVALYCRNYYFSSMSFRTLMLNLKRTRTKSQLLFQQYVLSDPKRIGR